MCKVQKHRFRLLLDSIFEHQQPGLGPKTGLHLLREPIDAQSPVILCRRETKIGDAVSFASGTLSGEMSSLVLIAGLFSGPTEKSSGVTRSAWLTRVLPGTPLPANHGSLTRLLASQGSMNSADPPYLRGGCQRSIYIPRCTTAGPPQLKI